jgi:hypothetical protein
LRKTFLNLHLTKRSLVPNAIIMNNPRRVTYV